MGVIVVAGQEPALFSQQIDSFRAVTWSFGGNLKMRRGLPVPMH
jgi:hypothetical protein